MMAPTQPQQQFSMPNNNEFDQTTAKRLLQQCGTLIVQNFPSGSEFGIDLSIHYTGDRFMGLKMIPPGLHFIYFSFVHNRSVGPRCGFYYHFKTGDFLVTKWDMVAEDLIIVEDISCDNSEYISRLRQSFISGQLDAQLGLDFFF